MWACNKVTLAKAFGRKPRVRQAGEGWEVPGPSEDPSDTRYVHDGTLAAGLQIRPIVDEPSHRDW